MTLKIEETLRRVYEDPAVEDLESLLSAAEPGTVREIFGFAEGVRLREVGDGILLRGVVEFSNFCRNGCFYCGLNSGNRRLKRYRMTRPEILESAARVAASGIQTVVLQSGEDEELSCGWLAEIISEIRARHDLAVTLAVGERGREDYRLWREAGADRYLLKIETSERTLYERLHPGMSFERRLHCLSDLRDLGYQVGSGIIVGLRGQTLETIARDIRFFKREEFDMIGIGPFIPHPETPLGALPPGGLALTLSTIALTRIVTRNSHIPATTALGSLGDDHRLEALRAGANVLMPNFTPQPYRKFYEIYPAKRCTDEAPGVCTACLEAMARGAGRFLDLSRGDSLKKRPHERVLSP